MSQVVTLSDINGMLDLAITERGPGYIYPAKIDTVGNRSCLYWHENGPGCIVGFVAHKLGASKGLLRQCENDGAESVIAAMERSGWEFPQIGHVVELLSLVQNAQDNGATWRYAVTNGRKILDLQIRNGDYA